MASGHGFPNFPDGQNYLQLLLKIKLLASPLEIVIQWVWEGGLRICISNEFPGDAGGSGPESTLRELLC